MLSFKQLKLLWKKDVSQILPQVTRRLGLHLNCRRGFSKAAVTNPHRRLTPASLWDRFLIGWAFTTDSTTTSATVVFGLPVSEHVMTFLACLGEKTNKQTRNEVWNWESTSQTHSPLTDFSLRRSKVFALCLRPQSCKSSSLLFDGSQTLTVARRRGNIRQDSAEVNHCKLIPLHARLSSVVVRISYLITVTVLSSAVSTRGISGKNLD